MVLAEMNIPEVVDVAGGVHALIVALGMVAMVSIGGGLAFMAIRKCMKWAPHSSDEWDGVSLWYEEQRIRHGLEAAMLDRDYTRAKYWGDRYESFWGEEARAEVEEEINQKHKLWMQ